MNSTLGDQVSTRPADWVALLARLIIGAVFIYMGVQKTLHPVEFLKLIRQYEIFQNHWALNLVASTLPWFEIFCGLLLMFGVAVRGTALVMVTMLVPFTIAVLLRALAIQKSGGLPFCSIKFDCGCGGGAVFICPKILENLLLTGASLALVFWRSNRLCARYSLIKPSSTDSSIESANEPKTPAIL
jgi:uncharacterized membrane protein YphA (DoxX/SURF4 family)